IALGAAATALWTGLDRSHAAPPERPADSRSVRLAILLAEDRRAPTPRDLTVIRSGLQSSDAQTVLIAVRALGRLERPALLPDIVPILKNPLPEIRREAANAIGQAVHQSSVPNADRSRLAPVGLDQAFYALTARLRIESEPEVRAVICETIGRLPYT